ncbi:MAG: hypothetical protein ACTSUE_14825 [Promethearchaeota archaeon]
MMVGSLVGFYAIPPKDSTSMNQDGIPLASAPLAPPVVTLTNLNLFGAVLLEWSAVQNAIYYNIYRDTSPINDSSIAGLSPLASTNYTNYTDGITVAGVNFSYVVVAFDGIGGNSSVSNCVVRLGDIILEDTGDFNVSIGDQMEYTLTYASNDSIAGYETVEVTAFRGYNVLGKLTLCYPNMTVWTVMYDYILNDDNNNSRFVYGSNQIAELIAHPYVNVSMLDVLGSSVNSTTYDDDSNYPPYREAYSHSISKGLLIGCLFTLSYTQEIYQIMITNISILLDTPALSPISPSPSIDGKISLNWSSVTFATNYRVYRDTSPIVQGSISGLTPIATPANTTFNDTVSSNGIYYYAIVAYTEDTPSKSNASNCESVLVDIPRSMVPGYQLPVVLMVALVTVAIQLKKRSRHISTGKEST